MTKDRDAEIVYLAEKILKNIELDQIPLRNILLRCVRLARLTGNENAINLFTYELNGYPKDGQGFILYEAFDLSRHVNRPFKQKGKDGLEKEYMFSETVAELEAELETARMQMSVAQDRNVSVASSNPEQYVFTPIGNAFERANLRAVIVDRSRKLQLLKNGYYAYALAVYNKRKFTDITEDIFKRKKLLVDAGLSKIAPQAIEKFVAVYDNLKSENNEDWANAAHSCRRIIKDVADIIYPASQKVINVGNGKLIKLDDANYIARLKQYIKERSGSSSFNKVVGSHLDFIGNRIDSLYSSANKGSHGVVTREEAERYTIYTYLLLADILSLTDSDPSDPNVVS